MKKTICHKNGTVSYWSVYKQSYIRGASEISDEELAAMELTERSRVHRHLLNGTQLWCFNKLSVHGETYLRIENFGFYNYYRWSESAWNYIGKSVCMKPIDFLAWVRGDEQ